MLSLYDQLLPQMREGDLELVFAREGASLLWKTDTGGGCQLGLSPVNWKADASADISRIAQFLRDGDRGKRPVADGSGPLDIAGVIRAALTAIAPFETTELWYRGQPSGKMGLQPSVFRSSRMIEEESSLLVRFMVGARSRHSRCPDDNDQAAWLALVQHYGLPTRLLDWSESVLVATYFAAENESYDSEPGVVWILSPEKLNEIQLGLPRQICYIRASEVQHLISGAFARGVAHVDTVGAVSPPELDLRLLMQLGRFTVHGSPVPLDSYPKQNEFLRRITIPAVAKKSIRAQLSCLGIRASTLFPDLNSLARDVRRCY